jgi:hypothetical protein
VAAAHVQFHLHFTPTYLTWLNEVERGSPSCRADSSSGAVFCSIEQLCQALDRWITLWNHDPHPFIWTATAGQILDKTARH